ncbi:MAG: YidC/Oxa1 family insertase periplasmic-domain containing protein [Victivallales bacterium]|nr:YidC/Oxa1 family insertase periplasmic-domain containing protein [Victivallales bacterium]
MKKYDAVSIIGTALCILVIAFAFVRNMKNPAPRAVQPAVPVESVESAEEPMPEASSSNDSGQGTVTSDGGDAQAEEVIAKEAALKTEPHVLSVENEFSATVDTNGRGVLAVSLDKYPVQTKKPEHKDMPVVMGKTEVPFMSLSTDFTLYQKNQGEITDKSVTTHRMDDKRQLQFDESWTVGNATGADHDYEIVYTLTVTNLGSEKRTLSELWLDCGALPSFLSDETNVSFSRGITGSMAYGSVEKNAGKLLQMKDITAKMTPEKAAGYALTPANWICVDSKYFVFALRELKLDDQGTVFRGFRADSPRVLPGEFFHAQGRLPEISLEPDQSRTITVTGYAGPKKYPRLQQMGQGIEAIVGMNLFFFWHADWMGWICRVLLEFLNWVAGWFPASIAYGMGIILVTFLVKLIFVPLAWKSTRDMRKMAAVQPQIKALREKYKNDPQHLYYEQQKLFKENGVSQFGGCLPMLVQIPVFFAMFNTFRGAIEIRLAPFLWVKDLSMPDAVFGLPIHPLALMTGATMYLQQRLTPMPDPNQGKMMNIMSIVFIFFFYNMPAGLTLYMTVNQLFSICQMLLFRRWEKKNAPAEPQKA